MFDISIYLKITIIGHVRNMFSIDRVTHYGIKIKYDIDGIFKYIIYI